MPILASRHLLHFNHNRLKARVQYSKRTCTSRRFPLMALQEHTSIFHQALKTAVNFVQHIKKIWRYMIQKALKVLRNFIETHGSSCLFIILKPRTCQRMKRKISLDVLGTRWPLFLGWQSQLMLHKSLLSDITLIREHKRLDLGQQRLKVVIHHICLLVQIHTLILTINIVGRNVFPHENIAIVQLMLYLCQLLKEIL